MHNNKNSYTVSQKMTSILLPISLADIDIFSIFSKFFFTVRFIKKFATKLLLHYPPHLKRVDVLPCEMTAVKNKHIFIMFPFCMDMGSKSWKPLVDRVLDDALLQTVPHVNQVLLQIVNVSHLHLINMVLHRTPHFEVGLRSGLLWGHRLAAMKDAAVMQPPHGSYWLGALSCWKMNKLPEITRISGNISCFSSTSR